MTIVPAPSAFSLAAARLAWPLPETACLTLHGRPVERLALHVHPNARLLILAHGAGSEARENLGIVVFWGVLFSTVLTIYVVPGYYALLARKTGSPGRVAHKLAEQARGREVVPDK